MTVLDYVNEEAVVVSCKSSVVIFVDIGIVDSRTILGLLVWSVIYTVTIGESGELIDIRDCDAIV